MTLTATSFDWVRALVHKESAIVLQPGKEYLVEARLLPIARQMGMADVSQFVETVRSRPSPDNTRRIVEALTTNETSWFRDGDPFTALTSTVLPELLASRGPADRLQIWSAACSSGQVALARRHHAAQRRGDLPLVARSGEVPDEHGGGETAVDLELAEPSGLRPLDHLPRQVRRGDRDPAGRIRDGVLEQHRDRVRLLPARAGRRPDLQPLVRTAGGEQ